MQGLIGRRHTFCYGTVAAAVLFVVFILLTPFQMKRPRMPDPWAYRFAVQNFAQGKWVVTDAEAAEGRLQARLEGGHLTQYVQLEADHWVLEKMPGYPLLVIPFYTLGVPRLANVMLALTAAAVLFGAFTAWRDEFAGFVGVVLFLFSPLALVAAHYAFMDTFASGALLIIAGALALWYDVCAGKGRGIALLLVAGGLAAAWAVLIRVVSGLLFLLITFYMVWVIYRHHGLRNRTTWFHLSLFVAGAGIVLGVFIVYNLAVFTRPLDMGYRYTPYPVLTSWELLPSEKAGTSPWFFWQASGVLQMLLLQLRLWFIPMLLGWPFLGLALVEFGVRLWHRAWTRPVTLALLWLVCAFVPYWGYVGLVHELRTPYGRGAGFFMPDRYVFPAVFALILMAGSFLTRLSPRWLLPLLALYAMAAAGYAWYALTSF